MGFGADLNPKKENVSFASAAATAVHAGRIQRKPPFGDRLHVPPYVSMFLRGILIYKDPLCVIFAKSLV